MTSSNAYDVQNFINGEFVPPIRGAYLDSENPATGLPWTKVPDSSAEDVEAAVCAAKVAFVKWSMTPATVRSTLLLKIADAIEQNLDEFAEVESRDQGKPVSLAKAVDIPRAVHNFRIFATSILHHTEVSTVMDAADAVNYVQRCPIGVAGLITPWNLPIYLLTFKIAPALAFGNVCVCKPSEMTSVTAFMLARILKQVGLPPGVCNFVFGTGPTAGEALVVHPVVKLLSFTGSTPVGSHIQRATADQVKKLSLELGGKNAGVVFADVDLERVVPSLIASSFRNQGEICLCTSRLFVQRPIYEDFLQLFIRRTRELVVGDPEHKDTWMGALISKLHWDKVDSYVKLAASDPDCSIRCGHTVDSLNLADQFKKGYFMLPTVITGMKDNSRLMQEEIFGPVVCITAFDTVEEVIRRANNVRYGLCASVWGKDQSVLNHTAHNLQVGTVWVNCWLLRDLRMPFGGCKMSGIGREGTEDSLDFFTEKKTICLKL